VSATGASGDLLALRLGALGISSFTLPAMNICEQAEAFRLLLLMGAISVSEIVSWADGVIATDDQPPEWLLDVSLAANDSVDKMEPKLRDLPCSANRVTAAYAAIERFSEGFTSGRISALSAARMLEIWAASAGVSHDDWTSAMVPSWIASEIGDGHASEDDVVSSIQRFLKRIGGA
jgi:hypothetical protein